MSNGKGATKGKARQTPAASTKGENSGASIPSGAPTQAPQAGSKRTYKEMDSDAEPSTPDPPPPSFRCLRNRVIIIQPPLERPSKRTKTRHNESEGEENAPIPSTSSPRESTPLISDTPMASTSSSPAPTAAQPLERVPTEIIEQPNDTTTPQAGPSHAPTAPQPLEHVPTEIIEQPTTTTPPPAGPSHAPPPPLHIDLSSIHIDLSPIPADALPNPPSPVPTEICSTGHPQNYTEIKELLEANGIKIRDFAYEDERYKRRQEEVAGGDTVVLEESAVVPTTTAQGNGRELRAQGGKVWSQQVTQEQEAEASTSTPVDDSKERVQNWLASSAYTSQAEPLQRQNTHEDVQTESPRKAANRTSLAGISSNGMLVAVM